MRFLVTAGWNAVNVVLAVAGTVIVGVCYILAAVLGVMALIGAVVLAYSHTWHNLSLVAGFGVEATVAWLVGKVFIAAKLRTERVLRERRQIDMMMARMARMRVDHVVAAQTRSLTV